MLHDVFEQHGNEGCGESGLADGIVGDLHAAENTVWSSSLREMRK